MSDSSAVVRTVIEHLRRARTAQNYQAAKVEVEAALEKLKQLEEVDRLNMELVIWLQYAVIAEHAADLPVAVEYREKLTVRRPANPTSYLSLSRLYQKLGNAEKAAESLRRCAELAEQLDDKPLLAALATKGHLPKEEDARVVRLEDAVATYREALESRSPRVSQDRYAATQQALGRLHRQQAELLVGTARARKLEEAADAYREALNIYTQEAFPDENRTLLENLVEIDKLLSDES